MIDLSRYQRLKPRGLSWIERVDNDIYLKFKRFSVEDAGQDRGRPGQGCPVRIRCGWIPERPGGGVVP
jgi:hypothetical protein